MRLLKYRLSDFLTLKRVLLIILLTSFQFSFGQNNLASFLSDIELRIDTNVYRYNSDRMFVENEWKLPFNYQDVSPVVEFRLYPRMKGGDILEFGMESSPDYKIIDSLKLRVEGYYYCKVKFENLTNADFLNLNLTYQKYALAVPLFPYTHTFATIYPGNIELYVGEERSFEIASNQPGNIVVNPIWIQEDNYEYRIHSADNKLLLSVIATTTGPIKVDLPIELYRPNVINKRALYQLKKQTFDFNVKGSRLKFLTFDKKEVIWEFRNSKGLELQIDNNRFLEINKTYRLEDSDAKGGPLVAELYTVRRLSNDRVLCMFRPHDYHRSSDGYLYIKDGDIPMFITNINILPEPKITNVSILRKGGSWVSSKQIYPGETVAIRLEGEGLNRADFQFEDLTKAENDSLISNETVAHYILKVPEGIRKKSIQIYSGNTQTGVHLDVVEYQRPRTLEFVSIDYGSNPISIMDITKPVLFEKTIPDVKISFNPLMIDDHFQLYGKQYLEVEVRIMDEKNKLIEKQLIDDIIVCPGIDSPRSFAYEGSNDCMKEAVSLNDYLSNKTNKLTNWSKIEIIVKHRKGLYDGQGYTHRMEIVRAKYLTFDVDLSVPAGLIIKEVGVPGFPGLSGISLAMLAQFSFYQRSELQKLYPFKVGAGFLAKNAFNFNPEADRDLGLVLLGSVYPTTKGRKISFPLYVGMGYYLYNNKFFFLIGPGISVNF